MAEIPEVKSKYLCTQLNNNKRRYSELKQKKIQEKYTQKQTHRLAHIAHMCFLETDVKRRMLR